MGYLPVGRLSRPLPTWHVTFVFVIRVAIVQGFACKKHGECLSVVSQTNDIFLHFDSRGAVEPRVQRADPLRSSGGGDILRVSLEPGCGTSRGNIITSL